MTNFLSILSTILDFDLLDQIEIKLIYVICYQAFYPTARGIVFTHGVWMGGRVVCRAVGKVSPGCISETIRSRKLILGRDIG